MKPGPPFSPISSGFFECNILILLYFMSNFAARQNHRFFERIASSTVSPNALSASPNNLTALCSVIAGGGDSWSGAVTEGCAGKPLGAVPPVDTDAADVAINAATSGSTEGIASGHGSFSTKPFKASRKFVAYCSTESWAWNVRICMPTFFPSHQNRYPP